ncbi:hypothetical protein ABK040_004011 [Willaertia magna]
MKRVKTKIGKTKQLSSIQNVATKRLMKDWLECNKNPLKGIAAAPVNESNLFLWHANLKGPKNTAFEKGIFHIIMNFPQNYPQSPPTLTLCTRIEHPNVIGNHICLDMLEAKTNGSSLEKFSGWSPAYTVQSILIQLQAFLFEADPSRIFSNIHDPKTYESKKREWSSSVKWSVEQSRNYTDKSVGHSPHKPFPPFPEDTEEFKHLFDEDQKEQVKSSKFVTPEELEMMSTKSELVCFFTRQTYEEDVLGYGISFSKNLRTGAIKSISSPLDLISLRAFMNHNLRTSAYNEKFSHWIPIYIDEKHGQKAMYLAKRSISIICTGSSKNFKPEMVLEVLPKLMCTMVVEVLSNRKHASIKALRGYCHFYRLLLEFTKEYPQLLESIDKTIKGFIENEQNRHKDIVPNLGEFLSLIPVSSYKWKDIQQAYIEESFQRSVFWLLNKYEELEQDSDEFTDDDRLKYSFETTKLSQKLLLFNVFFIERVSHPLNSDTFEEVRKVFDNHLGRPPVQYEDMFIEEIEKINKIESYKEFFQEICGKENTFTNEVIVKLLKESVKKSKEKGYHGNTLSVLTPEQFAKQTQQVDLESFMIGEDDNLLESDDQHWKPKLYQRWGISDLPEYLKEINNPWRKLYLQNNLQDVITKLNDFPDFEYFHKVLDLSIEIPRLEIQMFNPEKLKSKYYFLTCVLTKLKNLNTLIISRGESGLGVRGFRALIKGLANAKQQLESLILVNCGLGPNSIQELTKGRLVSSNLKRINLSGNPLGDDGAIYLSQFLRQHENLPHLTELDLSRCNIGQTGSQAIAEALLVKRELKILHFEGNPAQSGLKTILQNLAYSQNIQEINVSKIAGSLDNGLDNVGKLLQLSITLKKVNFWKTNGAASLSKGVFQYLGKSPSLKELDLAESNFSNVSYLAEALKENQVLEDLNLLNNRITCTELFNLYEDLIQLKQNEKSNNNSVISATNRNNKSDSDVMNFPPPQIINLKRLVLAKNYLSTYPEDENKYPRVIGELLKMSHKLVYLDLSKCGISIKHLETIGDALTPKYTLPLKTLLLQKNNIGKHGLKPLVSALQHNTCLETLDISGNDIGVVGCDLLSQIMERNTGIKTLNLFGNFIEIEGCNLLCKALKQNTTLTSLDLGLNRIRVRGATAVVELLKTNTTLKRIGLKHNHITDTSGLAIAKAITIDNPNSIIQYIALAGNYLSTPKRSDISLLLNSVKERAIVFDLAKLVEVKDVERQDRTVYITPVSGATTIQQIKRLFYQNHCGVILNVTLLKHKSAPNYHSSKYAFVEFAHPDSVQLAMRLQHKGKNVISGTKIRIAKAGIQQKNEMEAIKKKKIIKGSSGVEDTTSRRSTLLSRVNVGRGRGRGRGRGGKTRGVTRPSKLVKRR